jgi:hypothetical protein
VIVWGKLRSEQENHGLRRKFISKMGERRKWRTVNNEERRKNYRRLNNELRRVIDKAKLEYLESKCDEIMELQRTGRYDLMYRKAKELDWKKNNGIRSIGIDDSQGNIIVNYELAVRWAVHCIAA